MGLGAEPDGLTSVEVQRILDEVGRSVDVVGLTIAEFVPRQVMHLQQILQNFSSARRVAGDRPRSLSETHVDVRSCRDTHSATCVSRVDGTCTCVSSTALSVVEGVPADGAPALLIVENEFADSGREVSPLPFAFLGPSLRSVVGWDGCTGRPDGVRRSAQLMWAT